MSRSSGARRRLLVVPLGVLMVTLALPASGQELDRFAGVPAWDEYGFQGEGDARIRDIDAREAPSPPAQPRSRSRAGWARRRPAGTSSGRRAC